MALLMEKIVRPYVPVDVGPSKEAPKCRETVGSTALRFKAPAGLGGGEGKKFNLQQNTGKGSGVSAAPPQDNKQQKPGEKSYNSSWSYAYKKYMTKVEKEEDKCKEDDQGSGGIVGGQASES